MTHATELLLAGFGGQGMLLAGKILAQAAMDEGLEVSWLPSYGPEMRGGTANVIVCLSPEPIGSPLVARPQGLVAMNRPSLEKFAPNVRPGGVIVVNRTLIDVDAGRDDCTIIEVESRELAKEHGSERSANIVVLGAWLGATGALPQEAVERAIANEFAGKKQAIIDANVAAFRAGVEVGRSAGVPS
jgi:2-oxoglutarate ferredoxin oxidoreductase subunit gamma